MASARIGGKFPGLIVAAFLIFTPAASFAQGWIEYPSRDDLFWVNFPGEPVVEDTTWESEYGATFPARVHSVDIDGSRFSVTVADYREAEKIHSDQAKDCPPGAANCTGGSPDTVGLGYWRVDLQGSMAYAARRFLQSDAKLTRFMWNTVDLVEGFQIYLTNPDDSRTQVAIFLHRNRLYILESVTPKGALGAEISQQSLRFIDEQGKTVRYSRIYHNSAPPPPRVEPGNPVDVERAGRGR